VVGFSEPPHTGKFVRVEIGTPKDKAKAAAEDAAKEKADGIKD